MSDEIIYGGYAAGGRNRPIDFLLKDEYQDLLFKSNILVRKKDLQFL